MRFFSGIALAATVVALLAGCAWSPEHSFRSDKDWEQRMGQQDSAVREMPMHIEPGGLTASDNWNALFPGAED